MNKLIYSAIAVALSGCGGSDDFASLGVDANGCALASAVDGKKEGMPFIQNVNNVDASTTEGRSQALGTPIKERPVSVADCQGAAAHAGGIKGPVPPRDYDRGDAPVEAANALGDKKQGMPFIRNN